MAIAIVAAMPVRVENAEEFTKGFEELVRHVIAEPGNRLYQLFKSRKDGRLFVIEIFDDEGALKAHMESEHFRKGSHALAHLVEGEVDSLVLDAIGNL